MSEAPIGWWDSVDDVCDTTVRTCYHATCCYPCVYGAALHRLVYSTRFHAPLCTPSPWWVAGMVPCVGAVCLRVKSESRCACCSVLKDTVCCCCTGAPCRADDYRTHDVELHNLLLSYENHMLPIQTSVLDESDEDSGHLSDENVIVAAAGHSGGR